MATWIMNPYRAPLVPRLQQISLCRLRGRGLGFRVQGFGVLSPKGQRVLGFWGSRALINGLNPEGFRVWGLGFNVSLFGPLFLVKNCSPCPLHIYREGTLSNS